MLNKKLYSSLLVLILIMPVVSAYFGGYYGPLEYLDNEWVMFGLITLVFFAVIYHTVNRAFKNSAVSGTIALALSFLIALTFTRRGWLYGYAGDEIGTWILIGVSLISIGFFIRFAYEGLGNIGAIGAVVIVWLVLFNTDPYKVLPYEATSETFIKIYDFFASIFGLIVLVIAAILLSRRGNRTVGEELGRLLTRR